MLCKIIQGGGAHFGNGLWHCETCGREQYPEVFICPKTGKRPALAEQAACPERREFRVSYPRHCWVSRIQIEQWFAEAVAAGKLTAGDTKDAHAMALALERAGVIVLAVNGDES